MAVIVQYPNTALMSFAIASLVQPDPNTHVVLTGMDVGQIAVQNAVLVADAGVAVKTAITNPALNTNSPGGTPIYPELITHHAHTVPKYDRPSPTVVVALTGGTPGANLANATTQVRTQLVQENIGVREPLVPPTLDP